MTVDDKLVELISGRRPMKLSELYQVKDKLIKARMAAHLCLECGVDEQAEERGEIAGFCVGCNERYAQSKANAVVTV